MITHEKRTELRKWFIARVDSETPVDEVKSAGEKILIVAGRRRVLFTITWAGELKVFYDTDRVHSYKAA